MIASQAVGQGVGKSLTPEIPIVEVRVCTVGIVPLAIFFTVGRCRIPLILVTWFRPVGGCFLFRCLFVLGLSCHNGDIPDLFQKLAEDHLCCHPNVFARI